MGDEREGTVVETERIVERFLKLQGVHRRRIYVIGDGMVDEYYSVGVSRLSPEYPTPIMDTRDDQCISVPGGAANVAAQFKEFNVEAKYFGFIDTEAESIFNSYGLDGESLFAGYSLPRKKRFYYGINPIIRWDVETPRYAIEGNRFVRENRSKVFRALSVADVPDVIIYSDYDKGMFFDEKSWTVRQDVHTIVDPKNGPIEKWAGCGVLKLNADEAEKLTGKKSWREQADILQDKAECAAVVITAGQVGVKAKIHDNYYSYDNEKQRDAENVVGAGDCFVAFLAMGIASGMEWWDAMLLSYHAGSIYVTRRNSIPLRPLDLYDDPVGSKIIDREDIPRIRQQGYDIIFTNGCFDLLHAGHLHILEQAKSLDRQAKLVVGVNTDASIRYLKGGDRPVVPLEHRMRVLASLEFVDFVVPFDEISVGSLVEDIRPDILVKGGDYEPHEVHGWEFAGRVEIIPLLKGFSTSKILETIREVDH